MWILADVIDIGEMFGHLVICVVSTCNAAARTEPAYAKLLRQLLTRRETIASKIDR